jgi:hypothetical protein
MKPSLGEPLVGLRSPAYAKFRDRPDNLIRMIRLLQRATARYGACCDRIEPRRVDHWKLGILLPAVFRNLPAVYAPWSRMSVSTSANRRWHQANASSPVLAWITW